MAEAAGRSCAAFYANLKAQLGNKSASDLLDELDSKLEGEGSLSDEEIEAYMDLITELEPEPENPAFEAFTQDYIDRGRRSVSESEPAESGSKSPRRFPHYFGILVAVCGVFMAMMLFAYGEDVWNTVVHTDGDILHVSSGKMVLDEPGENGFYSLEEALSVYGIEGVGPKWIPEKYSLNYIEVTKLERYVKISAEYLHEDKGYFVIRIVSYEEKLPDIDYEMVEGTKTSISIHGKDYVLTENDGQYRAYWENGKSYCSIAGNVSEKELESILKSI